MKAKPNTMNKDKEPLLSFNDWFHKKTVNIKVDDYAKYHTKWHLNNAKEFAADEAYVCFDDICNVVVDKQSITNAVDKYIEDRL